jgi:hypothetical protein
LSPQGKAIVDVRVYIVNEFSEREKANIVNGILLWERATNGLVVWHLLDYDPNVAPPKPRGRSGNVEERAVLFRRAVSTDEWVVKWDEDHKPKTLLGLCQGNSLEELTWLWLVENRLTTPEAQTIVAAHEFGHAIGLDHIDDKRSVLSEFYSKETKCLTVHDLQEFCKKHHCDPNMGIATCLLE